MNIFATRSERWHYIRENNLNTIPVAVFSDETNELIGFRPEFV